MGGIDTIEMIHGRLINIGHPGDYPSFHSLFGRLAIWFLLAFTISTTFHRIEKRFIKILVIFPIFVLYGIQYFLISNFQHPISSSYLLLIAETNNKESGEFIKAFIFSDKIVPTLKVLLILLMSLMATSYVWEKYICSKILHLSKNIKILFSIFISFFIIYGLISCKIYYDIFRTSSMDGIYALEKPKDPFTCIFTSFKMLNNMRKDLRLAIDCTKKGSTSVNIISQGGKDSLNIILIIGESHIKWHTSLYSYSHNTTPHLNEEVNNGRLFVFNDVVTMSNRTSIVMKNILSCNNYSKGEEWYNYPFFPALFKSAGYDVYFWDNQKGTDNKADYSFTLNGFLYNTEICNLSYTKRNDSTCEYDDELIQSYINQEEKNNNKRNLIIFHLMGQHVHPASRFPHTSENLFFTKDSVHREELFLTPEKKQYIADYDNATLYNDKVLMHIFNHFSKSNSIAIYLSDHGEEAYDYRDQFMRDHGPLTKLKIKYQYEIPFMIWCSEKYKIGHPQIIKQIQKSLDKPFSIDHICHLLFGLANICTPFYHKNLDLLNSEYNCYKRKIEKEYYNPS